MTFTWVPDTPITGKNALEVKLSLDGVDGEYGVMCYTGASKSVSVESEEVKSSCGTYDFVLDTKDEYSFDFVIEKDTKTHDVLKQSNDVQMYNSVHVKMTDLILGVETTSLVTITSLDVDYNPAELVKGSLSFTITKELERTPIV